MSFCQDEYPTTKDADCLAQQQLILSNGKGKKERSACISNDCQTRRQGRPLMAPKGSDPVPIIQHSDVRRMLLFQKAVVEGSLALILHCGMYDDIHTKDASQKECHLLLELLTPAAKTYPSEMGILATSAAIQCFGGYGYCDDFPVEQHFRDMRIHPIHEGTTGIQAMDLLGRKLIMEEGENFSLGQIGNGTVFLYI